MFTIRAAAFPADLAPVTALFTQYAASLNIDLSFQDFAAELASLPGKYAQPGGVIFLALPASSAGEMEPEPIGLAALRSLPSPLLSPQDGGESSEGVKVCEIKRLFCTPASRGLGIGKALVERVMAAAREMGYDKVKLDTLPSMVGARKLYERCGFEEVGAYYETPVEGTIFLGRVL